MKNLSVLIFLFIFQGCVSYSELSSGIKVVQLSEKENGLDKMPKPIFLGDDIKYSMPMYSFRPTQFLGFRWKLKKEEKKQHEAAVYFMLDNVPDTVTTSWYSDKRPAGGKVRVIRSYPISGGYCRTYQTYIKVNGKEQHTTNNACKYITSVAWSFYY